MRFLIDQLVTQGVTDFFISPGSRNSSLILAAAENPKVKLYRHFDERGLGFYALGNSLTTGKPSVLIVTSGTAVGNLVPAVMEAASASIPLILLTADRPAELRNTGANQTSDQIKMFSNFIRFQFDLDPSMPLSAIASKIAQAIFHAANLHPGPVHINCPLREPLYPLQDTFSQHPISMYNAPLSGLPPIQLPQKGVILIGKLPSRKDLFHVLKLANKLQWPIFADLLSEARFFPTPEQIHHFDRMHLNADCILHFGDRLTSKKMEKFKAPKYIHVSSSPHWIDPFQFVTDRIYANISEVMFSASLDSNWLLSWQKKDQQIQEWIDQALAQNPHTESALFAALSHLNLEEHAVFFGNSMPIREANWFFKPTKCAKVFANRGLSGIDGNIATIAGIANNSPTLGVIGDLTALHDLNSLFLFKDSKYPITLIISNNLGGGIFSHLPVSQDSHSSKFIEFAHELYFQKASEMFDIPYSKPNHLKFLLPHIQSKKTQIIEWVTSRTDNMLFHKSLKRSDVFI